MSDLQGNDLDPNANEGDSTEPQGSEGPSAFHRVRETLSETIKAKSQVEQDLAATKRELAIERADLPDFPGKQFFTSNYAGEPDPAAIRAAAEAAGFVLDAPTEAVSESATTVSADELAAHRAVANVAAGSGGGGDIPLEDAIKAARSPEELVKILQQAPQEAGVTVKPNVL